MKTLFVLFGIFCTAAVVTESVVVGLLWQRGALSTESVHEIQDILTGANNDVFDETDNEESENNHTVDLVIEKRVMKILKMEQRMDELKTIKSLLQQSRDQLLVEKNLFESEKDKFAKEKELELKEESSEATEKARKIIAKLSAQESVAYLMKLTTEENVTILKGMQDKQLVAILSQFLKGNGKDAEKLNVRGHEIFKVLSVVRPMTKIGEKTAKAKSPDKN